MISVYFKFIRLSDEVRELNKIRSKERIDCIAFTDQIQGGYKGLTNFVNTSGHLCLYKTPAKEISNSASKRIAQWCLTNNSLNFSSIYIEDLDFPELGYGYPNCKKKLSGGKDNPLLPFANDCYLFITNQGLTEIEVFIIPDGKNYVSLHYQKMIDGAYELEFKNLREAAKPFYEYTGLSYSNLFVMTNSIK
jgi:hypothetical protein